MSLHRCKAVLIGLLESGRANEWVITEKLGDLLKSNPSARIAKRFQSKFWVWFHIMELTMGVYLMLCACYNYTYRDDYMYIFPQAVTFFVMGFGYMGTIIPSNKEKQCEPFLVTPLLSLLLVTILLLSPFILLLFFIVIHQMYNYAHSWIFRNSREANMMRAF